MGKVIKGLKSNCQTTSILCADCDYMENSVHGYYCSQFNTYLKLFMDKMQDIPVKCPECAQISNKQY